MASERFKPKASSEAARTSSSGSSKQLINIAKPSLLDLTKPPSPSAPPPSHLAPPLLSTPLRPSDSRSTFCGHVQAAHPPRVHSRRPFFRLPECPGSSFNSTQHNSHSAAHMAKTGLRDRDWYGLNALLCPVTKGNSTRKQEC